MSANNPFPTHLSYLVRLWREDDNWRASVENVHMGGRHVFANLDVLFLFIREETERPSADKKDDRS